MEIPEVNLGDYMEVVTTYHCKFCSHSCHTLKEMALHVQQDHLPITSGKEPAPNTQVLRYHVDVKEGYQTTSHIALWYNIFL